jgi:uncharacterized phage infection (PIP) family protein YhgE
MSILFGYDHFDTMTEDLNTLKRKLTAVEKGQQGIETQQKSLYIQTISRD